MKREIFIETINKEIEQGEVLLKDIDDLQPTPNQVNQLGSQMAILAGMVGYSKERVNELTTQLYLWEKRVKEILTSYLGSSRKDVVDEFVVSETEGWLDFKRNGTSSMRKNLNVLRSINNRLEYIDGGKDWGE